MPRPMTASPSSSPKRAEVRRGRRGRRRRRAWRRRGCRTRESRHGAPAGEGGDRYASTYYALEKEFTANLQDSAHFIQVGVAVSTPYDNSVIDHLKTNEIAVRSAILMALGEATEDEVFTAQGKRKLQGELAKAINATLKQKEGFGGIGNVYFTSFVVQ
ncbi:flagellar basal body-associated FliL family protein [Sphingomonas aerolata]|uniref:flagellar basal body-associated FliL family protein n=1 Tax=Sphingomonas aerolata TaxID=185951 RepID=UPI002FE2552A